MEKNEKHHFLLEELDAQKKIIAEAEAMIHAINKLLKKYAPSLEDGTMRAAPGGTMLAEKYRKNLKKPEKVLFALYQQKSGTPEEIAKQLVTLDDSYTLDKATKDCKIYLPKLAKSGVIMGERVSGVIMGERESGVIMGERESGVIMGERESGVIMGERVSGVIMGERVSGVIMGERVFRGKNNIYSIKK